MLSSFTRLACMSALVPLVVFNAASASGGNGAARQSLGSGCSGGRRLTTPIVPASQIAYWYPLGAMTGAHITPVDHLYVYFPQSTDVPVAAGTYLVRSPAAGVVTDVGFLVSDYRVVIEHGCGLSSIFIHVQKLLGPLARLNGKVTFNHSWGGSIPLRAGQAFADDSGAPGFDYGLYDARVTLRGLTRPATYASEPWKIHTVDPFKYWVEPTRSQYLAKDVRRTAPYGGKIDYDIAGTARGNWFVKGTNGYAGLQQPSSAIKPHQQRGYWDTHLALAYDPVDPSAIIVSIGNYGGCACQFAVRGNAPDPRKVTHASGTVVYQLVRYFYVDNAGNQIDPNHPPIGYRLAPDTSKVQGLLALRVNRDGTLTVEKLPGLTDPKQFKGFSKTALTYTR